MMNMNNGWNAIWLFFWVFAFTAYLIALFAIIGDLFRDHQLAGYWKAVWIAFLVFVPFLTAFAYLVTRGPGMEARRESQARRLSAASNASLRTWGPRHSPADEIAKARALADDGIITETEYETLKERSLAN